jgi:hypothetical protein
MVNTPRKFICIITCYYSYNYEDIKYQTKAVFRLLLFSLTGFSRLTLASFAIQDTNPKRDESRFTPVVIADNLEELMVFEVFGARTTYIA